MSKKAKLNKKLFSAIGEIDDELIREAGSAYELRPNFKKIGTIAASLILATVVTVAAVNIIPAFMPAGGEAPGNGGATGPLGDKEEASGEAEAPSGKPGDNAAQSSISVTEREEEFMRFTVIVSEKDLPMNITISGKNAYGEIVISTTKDTLPDGYIDAGAPSITVDDISVTELPSAPGSYDILVNFSHLIEMGCTITEIIFEPFGKI